MREIFQQYRSPEKIKQIFDAFTEGRIDEAGVIRQLSQYRDQILAQYKREKEGQKPEPQGEGDLWRAEGKSLGEVPSEVEGKSLGAEDKDELWKEEARRLSMAEEAMRGIRQWIHSLNPSTFWQSFDGSRPEKLRKTIEILVAELESGHLLQQDFNELFWELIYKIGISQVGWSAEKPEEKAVLINDILKER